MSTTRATIEFELHSSHDINGPNFASQNTWVYPFPREGFAPGILIDWVVAKQTIRKLRLSALPSRNNNLGNSRCKLEVDIEGTLQRDDVVAVVGEALQRLWAFWVLATRSGYYGLPVVEPDWISLHVGPQRSTVSAERKGSHIDLRMGENLHVETYLQSRGIEPVRIPMEDTKAISFNSVVELFLDGVKANLPQSKYLLWFNLVEKYVENNQRTSSSFHSLFSDHDEKAVRDLADKLDSLKKRDVLLGIFSATEESRAEKLHRKLVELSITSIDVQTCRKLIQYRNELAHTGKPPDTSLLYDMLLPLCRKLVEISPSLTGDSH